MNKWVSFLELVYQFVPTTSRFLFQDYHQNITSFSSSIWQKEHHLVAAFDKKKKIGKNQHKNMTSNYWLHIEES